MEYQLVFSPELGITPDAFATAWNAETDTQTVAEARLAPSTNRAYNDPLLDVVLLVVTNVGLGLATNALYDGIKGIIAKQNHHKRTKITKLDQPDGTHLLVVEEEE
jgi:hypothetical protein